MRALDLFCGAGGASRGYELAGFEVVGIDIVDRSKRYPYEFHAADAMEILRNVAFCREFDIIHASPPCQRYSMANRNNGSAHRHPDLVPPVREALIKIARPWVIENVVGAPLRNPTMLCGTMFGLKLLRHRLFETSFAPSSMLPPCSHVGDEVPVYGNGTPSWHLARRNGSGFTVDEQRKAMGIDWMIRSELSQAIPPAYTKWIAQQFLAHRRAA